MKVSNNPIRNGCEGITLSWKIDITICCCRCQ
jgi:hypothetical protein